MKRILLAAAFGMIASLAQAGITSDQVLAEFQKAGFTNINVVKGPSQIKVEARQNGAQIEVIYDIATGKILSQSSHPTGLLGMFGANIVGTSGEDVGDDNGGSTAGSDDPAGHDAGDDNGGTGQSGKSGQGGGTRSSND